MCFQFIPTVKFRALRFLSAGGIPPSFTAPRSGNQLNFSLTHNCITENPLVTKLHTSDHFLVQFSMINVFLSVSPTNYVHLYYTAVSSAALRSERTSEQQRRCGTNQSPDRPKNQSLYALTFPNSSSATNPQTFDCCRKLQTSFSSLVLIQNMLYLTKSLIFFHRTAVKPPEDSVRFNQPKRAHVTPLLVSLHWHQVDACCLSAVTTRLLSCSESFFR